MGVSSPYLFSDDPDPVSVRGDREGSVTVLTVRGAWNRPLWQATSTALRKCFAEHPIALVVDLCDLADETAESAPTWLTAQSVAAGMEPPVQMALCISPELVLADRLQRMGARKFLPVYAKVRQALVAIDSRLPLTERLALELTPDAGAARLARTLVTDACQAWELPQLLDAGLLVVTELVANAVEHARSPITLRVSRRGSGLHIAVTDQDPRPPRLLESAGTGRGLRTVHAAATVWGSMPAEGGKVVWATIRPAEGIRRLRA